MNEEFPRVQVMRGHKKKGVRYFGPYGHAWAIRDTVDLLLRVFPVRTSLRRCLQERRPDRPPLSARLHRQVLGALRRAHLPDDHWDLADEFCDFHGRPHRHLPAPPGAADGRGGRRDGVRAGGTRCATTSGP
ncbi:hypothetical protein LV779_32980 [Streptomyces thinghirensis]|nr:hypothetical protein [Streptomyces thinghirensis]